MLVFLSLLVWVSSRPSLHDSFGELQQWQRHPAWSWPQQRQRCWRSWKELQLQLPHGSAEAQRHLAMDAFVAMEIHPAARLQNSNGRPAPVLGVTKRGAATAVVRPATRRPQGTRETVHLLSKKMEHFYKPHVHSYSLVSWGIQQSSQNKAPRLDGAALDMARKMEFRAKLSKLGAVKKRLQ